MRKSRTSGNKHFTKQAWCLAETDSRVGNAVDNHQEGCGKPVDGYGVGTAFYGETGTLFIGGGNEYKIADIKGKTIKEVKSDLKFETGNLLNPSEKLDAFHFRNWFDAIRKGTKLNSGIVDACII